MHYGPISDKLLLTLHLTSEENVSRYVSVQIVDILNTFCEQTLAICIFHVFLVQVASNHRVSFFVVFMLDGR